MTCPQKNKIFKKATTSNVRDWLQTPSLIRLKNYNTTVNGSPGSHSATPAKQTTSICEEKTPDQWPIKRMTNTNRTTSLEDSLYEETMT